MWLLQLGLYELTRPKEQADDWIWFIDHTIQTGRGKCLIVVGVRRVEWEAKRIAEKQSAALTHQDLSVWMIEPVEKSDGELVLKQLSELSQRTGVVPAAILSDCGADLKKGIAAFCEANSQTIGLNDIAHAAANAVKRELNGNAQWNAFLGDTGRTKAQIRQTKFAFLLPPDLKDKARWMNLDALLEWSRKTLDFLNAPRSIPDVSWEPEELEQKIGWLRGHREALTTWSHMLEVTGTTLRYVREHGFHANAKAELAAQLTGFITDPETPASRVANKMLTFVQTQSSRVPKNQHLPGSTEVLESLIGKTKQLEGLHSKSGFTKMILSVAACVSKITDETLQAAFTAVPVIKVREWIKTQLGTSVQGQRYHAFPPRLQRNEK